MRYTNWDVLLFPEGSKTPLQEFKTSCYVTDDPGNDFFFFANGHGNVRFLHTYAPWPNFVIFTSANLGVFWLKSIFAKYHRLVPKEEDHA